MISTKIDTYCQNTCYTWQSSGDDMATINQTTGSHGNITAYYPGITTDGGCWSSMTSSVDRSAEISSRLDKIEKDLETLKKVFSWLFTDQENTDTK